MGGYVCHVLPPAPHHPFGDRRRGLQPGWVPVPEVRRCFGGKTLRFGYRKRWGRGSVTAAPAVSPPGVGVTLPELGATAEDLVGGIVPATAGDAGGGGVHLEPGGGHGVTPTPPRVTQTTPCVTSTPSPPPCHPDPPCVTLPDWPKIQGEGGEGGDGGAGNGWNGEGENTQKRVKPP